MYMVLSLLKWKSECAQHTPMKLQNGSSEDKCKYCDWATTGEGALAPRIQLRNAAALCRLEKSPHTPESTAVSTRSIQVLPNIVSSCILRSSGGKGEKESLRSPDVKRGTIPLNTAQGQDGFTARAIHSGLIATHQNVEKTRGYEHLE